MALYRHENGAELEIIDENHVILAEREGFKPVEAEKPVRRKKAETQE